MKTLIIITLIAALCHKYSRQFLLFHISLTYEQNFPLDPRQIIFHNLCLSSICLLKKTGAIYVSVPNAEGFKDYLREVPNYFNQEHINYFTSGSLDLLCARSGLARCSSDADCYHVVGFTTFRFFSFITLHPHAQPLTVVSNQKYLIRQIHTLYLLHNTVWKWLNMTRAELNL